MVFVIFSVILNNTMKTGTCLGANNLDLVSRNKIILQETLYKATNAQTFSAVKSVYTLYSQTCFKLPYKTRNIFGFSDRCA